MRRVLLSPKAGPYVGPDPPACDVAGPAGSKDARPHAPTCRVELVDVPVGLRPWAAAPGNSTAGGPGRGAEPPAGSADSAEAGGADSDGDAGAAAVLGEGRKAAAATGGKRRGAPAERSGRRGAGPTRKGEQRAARGAGARRAPKPARTSKCQGSTGGKPCVRQPVYGELGGRCGPLRARARQAARRAPRVEV